MTKEQLVNFMDWLDSKGYAKDFCTAHDYIAQVYLDQMNQQTGTNTLVSGSVCDHTYIAMEEPMIVKFTHQCSKCGKTKAN